MSARTTEPRTERPSPRRLRRARQAGLVAHSPVLTGAVALAAALLAATWLAQALGAGLTDVLRAGLGGGDPVAEDLVPRLWHAAVRAGEPLLALLLIVTVAALVAGLAQVGPLFAWRPLRPDWGRIGLGAGWRRLGSEEARWARWRGLLAALAVLVPGYVVVTHSLRDLVALPHNDAAVGLAVLGVLGRRWATWAMAGLAVVGVLDWALARRRLRERLRMTRHEVEDEQRETEGAPIYRAERLRIQHQLMRLEPGRALRESAVLVASPRVAVALFYDPVLADAPEVVACARGRDVPQLRRNARALGVPVVEQHALAEQLGRVAAGDVVPEETFDAVAAVLREARR